MTGMGEGKGTLWFYCVDQEEEEKEEKEVVGEEVDGASRGEERVLSGEGAGSRRSGGSSSGGGGGSGGVGGSKRSRTYQLFRPPPHPTRVITEVRVPFTVLSPIPSPSLKQITAATDPLAKTSPALATVRLLVSLIAKSRGIPAGSDEALVEVAAELAAVLQLNVSPTAPMAVGEPGSASSKSPSSSAAPPTFSPRSTPSSSSESGAATADTLAALVEAIESGEGAGSGSGRLGAMAAGGEKGKHVKFSCHLARHDYFSQPLKVGGVPLTLEEERELACDDFAAWAFPLRGGAGAGGGRRGRR